MRRRLAAVLAIAVAILSAGIVVLATAASAASHTIVIKNLTFTPATLNVAVGDTVTWVNQETDGTTHSVRGPWTSPDITPGSSFTVTISAAGTYDYFCGFHPFMTGEIVAGGSGGTTTTTAPATTTTTRPATGTTTTRASTATTTTGATGSSTTTTSTSTSTCSGNPPLGADQGDGTKLAAFTVAPDGYKEFCLRMAPIQWTVSPGVVKSAYAFNGIIPGPTIKVNEGDKLRFIVQNDLPEPSAVHWHGMVLPNDQDGVPDITQPHIMPGDSYTYQWTAVSTGTHWYHTHAGGSQVGKGLYGALLVTPTTGDIAATRHYTQEIGDGANGFTLNGKSYPATVPLPAKVGEKIHIRLIGTGPEMIHPMHLHGQPFQVVAQDGQKLTTPYTVDTLMVAVGQTYDIIITPQKPGNWLFHCHIFSHSENATGMAGLVNVLQVTT